MKTIRSRLLNHCIYQRAKARGEKQSYPEGEHKRDCDICQAADELSLLSSEGKSAFIAGYKAAHDDMCIPYGDETFSADQAYIEWSETLEGQATDE